MKRPWTAEEDVALAEMVRRGLDYAIIGKRLGRTVFACRLRASGRLLRKERAAVLENRKAGRERFYNNPAKVRRQRKAIAASYTPLARMIAAEEARTRNRNGTFGFGGRHHTPEARGKISAALTGRRFTQEHREKIGEGQRRHWALQRGQSPIERYRSAMAGGGRIRDNMEAHTPETIWCSQCDRLVRTTEAAACQRSYCKAETDSTPPAILAAATRRGG